MVSPIFSQYRDYEIRSYMHGAAVAVFRNDEMIYDAEGFADAMAFCDFMHGDWRDVA